ncbi:MAG: YggS family pyridoxal phosphate-dependent enzyme [Lachnospiraceae bacterium]|nr:YggS family pyridoxal phosphate-dependent enzyme [Lachnospiraceae bacterium]
MVKENLTEVEERIQAACRRAGRDRSEVTLIAVSKTKPVPMLEEAYQYGIREFGENKVQEMMDKYEVLPQDIRWHMIGHLQRNKVKYLMGKAYLIHSVDSLRLAEEISAQSVKHQVQTNILIEVNIAGEASKFGISGEETFRLVTAAAALPNIHVKGLMTIAPFVDNPEDNRVYFQKIRELSVDIGCKKIDNVDMHILSMGMTGDYEVAIEEGATHIRVGTGIFGERDYNRKGSFQI